MLAPLLLTGLVTALLVSPSPYRATDRPGIGPSQVGSDQPVSEDHPRVRLLASRPSRQLHRDVVVPAVLAIAAESLRDDHVIAPAEADGLFRGGWPQGPTPPSRAPPLT